LIYNPASGGGATRPALLAQVAQELNRQGFDTEIVETTAANSAGAQARDAVERGAEVVFACGGDGTVHEVLQGMVGSPAAMGVLPFGSQNALARDLGLSSNILEAARQHERFTPRPVPVGRLEMTGQTRYFVVMAGAGPDGALVYRMLARDKRWLGSFAYYTRAAWLFAGRRFRGFNVEWMENGTVRTTRAVEAMVVRVADMGGLFRGLGAGAGVDGMELRLVLVKPPAWLSLPLWFSSSWVGLRRWNPWVRIIEGDDFHCTGDSVDVQADGEWIGRGPVRISLHAAGVHLLMPMPKA
jgi:diacylglycerol kinase (ATP)